MTSLNGQQSEASIKLFMKKYGDTVGGKKIEYFTRDTTGPNPEVAKRLVQEAVTREKAQILIGPDFTPNRGRAARRPSGGGGSPTDVARRGASVRRPACSARTS